MNEKRESLKENLVILLVEDNLLDAELEIAELESLGYRCEWDIVETRKNFIRCLETREYDLIFADYNLPSFDGLTAFKICQQKEILTPFIIITGKLGEEFATESLKAGATDYVIKSKLSRLGAVVERALKASQEVKNKIEMEKALVASEKRLRSIVDTAPDAIIVFDILGNIVSWNTGAEIIFGYKSKEILGKQIFKLIPEKISFLINSILSKEFVSNELYVSGFTKEFIGINNSGVEIPVEISMSDWNVGDERYLTAIIRDISERKKAQNDIEKSEERFRSIFEKIAVPIIEQDYSDVKEYIESELSGKGSIEEYIDENPKIIDEFGKRVKILKINKAALKLFEAEKIQMLFDYHQNLLVPDNKRSIRKFVEAIQNNKRSIQYETTINTIQNNQLELIINVSFFENQNRVLLSMIDITYIKKIEFSLRETKSQIEQIINNLPSFLIKVNSENRIKLWNNMAEKTFQIKSHKVINKDLSNSGISWDTKTIQDRIQKCASSNEILNLERFNFIRPDGEDRVLGMKFSPINSNNEMNVIIMGADITERVWIESQLSQARKLESIGQLAAGISHEINTPTQYISNNIDFLNEAYKDLFNLIGAYDQMCTKATVGNQELQKFIENLQSVKENMDFEFLNEQIPMALDASIKGLNRVTSIVKSMNLFSHQDSKEMRLANVNDLIESTIIITKNEWKHVARIDTDLDKNLPDILCYFGEFNQVILNIIINAVHAIEDKFGKDPERGLIKIQSASDNDNLIIRITDNGTGIPEKSRERVFDPFYTTKAVGKGTGQGLSISYDIIVNKHKGNIFFETEEGLGTTFIIQLPIKTDSTKIEQASDIDVGK